MHEQRGKELVAQLLGSALSTLSIENCESKPLLRQVIEPVCHLGGVLYVAGVQSPGLKSIFISCVSLGKSLHLSELLLPHLFLFIFFSLVFLLPCL